MAFTAGVEIRRGDEYRITLKGEIDMANEGVLLDLLDACHEADARRIVLDMRGVTFCGSPGVHAILRARREGRVEVAVVASVQVMRTLEASGVLDHGLIELVLGDP